MPARVSRLRGGRGVADSPPAADWASETVAAGLLTEPSPPGLKPGVVPRTSGSTAEDGTGSNVLT
jgi:hypothetical protein